ncbi:antibiotic biosynthesis monooxygenase [Agrobacterium rhizogenes]|uniref:antibiotic biosynthesis monooxygenase family protein n=1 Tax=Rhizobium TaxID=379 RepID=UPI0004D6E85A|nr:antibiotic biosynthesis monooxygenase family protein [Rhizobium rhizogenes]OCJ23510.1 antibiotic biosynthesis monooxygenase [Agrobacterium sp. B131/95]OCJ29037.1 antibiotic biosynthesis monooxygenase [Agrobacterium sp. B133/95]KEA03104.1 antibiotic biosynthesis monooxygenase [Rhizobium rhizogenes]MDJ1635256.1 antibiotic biosynthesis monooxygenase family protein [Rhizobium rhizogenes]MQB35085.1 antibiotic biosynthesis monooxygenase [Rhizobium rhizogenes]
MSSVEPLDPSFPLTRQMEVDAAPIVLVNLCTMAPEDEAAFLVAWAADAAFMKSQPGFISTQLHRALGDSPTYLNYAVFESAAAWRAAFRHPDFREATKAHPASAVFRPHLFQKVAVPNLCTA